jgi:hypothetical protein
VTLRVYPAVQGNGHFFYRRSEAWKKDLGDFLRALTP